MRPPHGVSVIGDIRAATIVLASWSVTAVRSLLIRGLTIQIGRQRNRGQQERTGDQDRDTPDGERQTPPVPEPVEPCRDLSREDVRFPAISLQVTEILL